MATFYKRIEIDSLGHFLTDNIGTECGQFSINEKDLIFECSREINISDQPAQITVSHPKIPGLSMIIFFYSTIKNQFQPRIAFDLPTYLRADSEVNIHLAGMNWSIMHKFEGSSWLTSKITPKTINDRWCPSGGNVKKVDIRIKLTQLWFKQPLFSCSLHPLQTKKCIRQPDFTSPDSISDVNLLPSDANHRRLFAHSAVLAMNSSILYERIKNMKSLNQGDASSVISMPFDYDQVLNFLKMIYPDGDLKISRDNVEGLMEIAKEYQTIKILRKCEKFLYKELECGSGVLVYHLARKFDLRDLQSAALLHLSDMNGCQLQSRINLDLKKQTPEVQENILNEISSRLAHMSI